MSAQIGACEANRIIPGHVNDLKFLSRIERAELAMARACNTRSISELLSADVGG
jgi:hypothetical protein